MIVHSFKVRHEEPPVCKYYQRSHCRHGNKCQQPHISKIGNIGNREKKHNSIERHTRTCKFYAGNGECKWKDACAYEHKKWGSQI